MGNCQQKQNKSKQHFVYNYTSKLMCLKKMPIYRGKIKTWDDLILFALDLSKTKFHLDVKDNPQLIYDNDKISTCFASFIYRDYEILLHDSNYWIFKIIFDARQILPVHKCCLTNTHSITLNGTCSTVITEIRTRLFQHREKMEQLLELYKDNHCKLKIDIIDLFLQLSEPDEP